MIGKLGFRIFFTAAIISLAAIAFPAVVFAGHKTPETGEYQFLVGSGLLCGLPIPDPCPVVTKGANGDIVEITGAGTITLGSDSATGGGTFVHKDGDGNVIGAGTWTVTELVTFKSWGTQADLPADFEGGRARMRVHLTSTTGIELDATLKIACLIGDFPSTAKEGIKLRLRGAPDFDEEVSGATLFIRTE